MNLAIFGQQFSHTDEASFLFSERLEASGVVYFKNIFEVFEGVKKGDFEAGIVPFENSSFGSVFETLDEFMDHPEMVLARAVENKISQNLLAKSQGALEDLEKIYSHPQALGQSKKFLQTYCPNADLLAERSTVSAAKRLLETQNPGRAAIGSVILAENLGLEVLAEDISDSENRTKFVLIKKGDLSLIPESRITSFVLWFKGDKSGNLAKVLTLLADQNVNLTKLDSRRATEEYGHYLFFIDAEISVASFQNFLPLLKNLGAEIRILGGFSI